LSAARNVSMALVAKKSARNALTVSRSIRRDPMTASTWGAMPLATGAGSISKSWVIASWASSRPPKTPDSAPKKMQNGKSETTNEKATAPAIAKPECSYRR
jgi:hypothetical protein